jgi:hypothetical protein
VKYDNKNIGNLKCLIYWTPAVQNIMKEGEKWFPYQKFYFLNTEKCLSKGISLKLADITNYNFINRKKHSTHSFETQ